MLLTPGNNIRELDMRKVLFGAALLLAATPAAALDCSDLRPTPPKDTDTTFLGKLDASITGFFARFASVGTAVDGTYKEVAKNVLPEFPNADKLYMWERVLFLQCQLMNDLKDLTTVQKFQSLGDIAAKTKTDPPSLDNSSSVITNTGNTNIFNQGTGNTGTINAK